MDKQKNTPTTKAEEVPSKQLNCTTDATNHITFTRVTSSRTLTKIYSLDASTGSLNAPKTSANMYEGTHEHVTIESAADFAAVLQGLTHKQALIYGIAPAERPKILSTKGWNEAGQPTDTITRTNKWFEWPPGAGVMVLDFDYHNVDRTKKETIAIIKDVLPDLESTSYVWWCSSSSFIYNGDKEINGLRGQRLYIFVKNAADIARAGKALFARLWLAGHGHMEISKTGSFLTRGIIDDSVWQTSRLDFAAGANCASPLTQERPAPGANEGGLLDTQLALPDLTGTERVTVEALQREAKQQMQPEADLERQLYIEGRATADLAAKGITEPTDEDLDDAKQAINRALKTDTLTGDFVLTLDDGETITVGEVLDDPAKYHRTVTKDPLEPDYDGGRTVGIVYLFNGRPTLYSHAHGGKSYKLIRQPRRIEHIKGSSVETVNSTLLLLREIPDLYDMAEQMVVIGDGKPRPITQELLPYVLGSIIQYWQWVERKDGNVQASIDPPMQVIRQILAMGASRQLKPLKAVITAPTITVEGHVISRGGYDPKTQLYLAMNDAPPTVPLMVEPYEAIAALDQLMEPFNTFPFANDLDRSVCLSAVLTALIRPVVDTAPAFAIDAPKQGTGKTYLAECIGLLGTGTRPAALPPVDSRSDDEVRKRLFAELLRGSRNILWDNVMGAFNSGSLASFLTAETFADRVLGKSETRELPNRALFLITGNNLQLAGELPRRVLTCRLDSALENPTTRSFTFSPSSFIAANRQQLVKAGLTLIRGYLQSDEHQFLGGVKPDRLASFEDWDTLARQVVCWVAKFDDSYTDPKESINTGIAHDPEQEVLCSLLRELKAKFGDGWFTAKQVHDAVNGSIGLGDFDHHNSDLKDVVDDMLSTGGNARLSTRGIGRLLGFRRDRIADGLKLASSQQGKKAAVYRIEEVGT